MISSETNHSLNGSAFHPNAPTPKGLAYDAHVESLLLGSLMLRNDLLPCVPDLETEDFYDPRNKVVWETIRNLQADGVAIDCMSVGNHLIARDAELDTHRLDAIGGFGYLGLLVLAAREASAIDLEEILDAEKTLRRLSKARQDLIASEEIDRIAAEEERPTAPKKIGRTWDDCVEEIYARKDEPWIDIRIGLVIIATCRNGSFVPLIAPSGAGKSTLAIQMLVDHALNRGPAVYLTYELDGDEAVARAIGQQCSFSWAAVLRGEVPRPMVPLVGRLRVLERDHATLENLEKVVAELRKDFPDQPVFVVCDYLQATPAPPGKERGFVANVSSDLRRISKKLRVVLIGVSQASTANAKAMRSGELLGIDGSATGAETAQIERDAYVILTLGDRQQVDPDTVSWKLSTAKYRLGTADVVHELHYRGRVGVWEVFGEPRMATEVRDTRDTEAKKKKLEELKRSIAAFISGSTKPVSKRDIVQVSTGKERTVTEAIRELLQEGVIAHVHSTRKGGHALIWTPEKLALEGGS